MQGYSAYAGNKLEKEMAREQARVNEQQAAAAEAAAEAEKARVQLASVGASGDYSRQSTINAEMSAQAAETRKKRAFAMSRTINNTNLLGSVTGKTILGG